MGDTYLGSIHSFMVLDHGVDWPMPRGERAWIEDQRLSSEKLLLNIY